MIYLKLFLTFLKIGLVSFGGGYAMIPLMQESVISNGWLTEEEMLNFIAISESTPGPISINLAIFIGAEEGGILGSIVSTFGVALPSFIIILIISIFIKKVIKQDSIKSIIEGIKPVISALILSTGIMLFLSVMLSIDTISSKMTFEYLDLILFVVLGAIYCFFYKWKQKELSPIILILIAGIAGMLIYGL